jgi:tetratricopeptide (TPR) repeat protein
MKRFATGLVMLLASSTVLAQESRAAVDKTELARKAQQAFDDKDWEGAVSAYRGLLKVDDKNAVAWHHLGYALHTLNRLDEALEAHFKAAEFPRTRPSGHYNAGCAYALMKDKDRAFEQLMKAAAAGLNQTELIESDTDLDSLRDDPRWARFAEAVRNATPSEAAAQAFTNPGERRSSRILWFGAGGSPGQAVVSFGPVAWNDAYSKLIESRKIDDKRWRFGKDFWTTLDTNVTLAFGDTKVPPGYYYMTLERKADGRHVVAFNDADAVRKLKLDAFHAARTKGGIEVVLKAETLAEPAGRLDIALSVDENDQTLGALTVRFGPHKLSAPLVYHLAKP